MGKKYWRCSQAVVVPEPPTPVDPDFDKTKKLYTYWYGLKRIELGTNTPSVAFEQLCEDLPADLSATMIDNKIAGSSGVDYHGDRRHTKWGRTMVHPARTLQYSQQPLTENIDFDTGNIYTTGNLFRGVCYYYIYKNVGGLYPAEPDIMDIKQILNDPNLNPEYDDGGGILQQVVHNNATYTGFQKVGTTSVRARSIKNYFKIGTNTDLTLMQTTAGNLPHINWYHGDMSRTNPWSNCSGTTVVYNPGTTILAPPLLPILRVASGYLSVPNTSLGEYGWFAVVVATKNTTNLTNKKIF